MSTDLTYLTYTAILTAALWIPYVVAQVVTNGFLKPANYVDPAPRPLPNWGKRADRTYVNAVEAFAPFAALVIVAHVSGKANAMTAFWTTFFFWMRVVHAFVYLTAIPYVRTVVFTLGFVAVAGLFWEIVK
ncbi:MAG: MAPEG family protein [Rhodomicrobium sp.]